MITCKDFWNMRARSYDEQVGGIYEEAYRKTVENSLHHLSPGDRVLEFACGTGIVTFQIAPHVASLQAIDISDEMVAKAQAKLERAGLDNLTIRQLDLFDPSLDGQQFDAVMGFNVLCYVEDLPRTLARIRSLLRPGGVFLSATDCLGQGFSKAGLRKFWKSHTGSMPYVAFFRTKQLEKQLEKAGFTILERENLFPAPPNLFLAGRK